MTLLIEYSDSSHICNTSADMLQRKIQQSFNLTLALEDKVRDLAMAASCAASKPLARDNRSEIA
jgi:hypothetical protein